MTPELPGQSVDSPQPRHSWLAIGVFLALLFILPSIGYLIYSQQVSKHVLQTQETLSRISQIRAATVAAFIHERIGDAEFTSNSPFLRQSIASWIQQEKTNTHLKRQIRTQLVTLKRIYDYVEISLLDLEGNILISTEDIPHPIDSVAATVIARSIASNEIQVSSIHPSAIPETQGRIVNITAPVFLMSPKAREMIGILLLRFTPQQQIYQSLQAASFPWLPDEALLVEIQGDRVVLLSDVPLGTYHYLDEMPLKPHQVLASIANASVPLKWETKNGIKELGAVSSIEGVPWFVVAQVSEDAAYSIVRDTAIVAIATGIITLCILGAGILLWWKYKESELKLATLQTETKRRLLQRRYDYLSKYANDMIILTNADYKILEVNDKTLEALGYARALLTRQPITFLSSPADLNALKTNLENLRHEGTAIFETFQKRSNGTFLPVEVSARTIGLEGELFSQFICRDITERKEAERKIQSLAYYDNVTALPNRTLLNDRLDQAIHMTMRSAKKVGVVFMDLDNFKNINDALGHQIGDMLLHAVGQRILGCARQEDTVARIGGDEFLVVLPALDRGEEARHVAEKIIAKLATPFLLQGTQVYTTTSIGISLFPDDAIEVPDLIKYADSALYEAKSRGRNNYQFFTQNLNDQITRGSKIEQRLRYAMEANKLSLWYQPQIDVRTGKIIGAEALLRWAEADAGGFSPIDFISVAEERGLIMQLGEWTIREACKQCRLWQKKGLPPIPVAVNVSPIQLQQKEFVDLVIGILKESDLDARYLELEITETSVMRRAQVVADLATRLRHKGVRISIDDFGTGYSSLSFLKHIPIDKIKIDKSFICDMLDDAEDETITQAIIKLAQSLRLRVIAEGVEFRAQMERLLSLGCHEAQGYLYSRAVSPETFQLLLAKEQRFANVMLN